MAITVEDGTGLAAAESYISEANADTYFTSRDAPVAWTGLTTALKESALRYATEWLDGRFTWVGAVANTAAPQALGWPRVSAVDHEGRTILSTTVPAKVADATCEVALAHATTALNSAQARGGQVASEKVGSIQVSYQFGAPAEDALPHIARMLRGYGVSITSGIIDVVRS
jgi:hypothetical protein